MNGPRCGCFVGSAGSFSRRVDHDQPCRYLPRVGLCDGSYVPCSRPLAPLEIVKLYGCETLSLLFEEHGATRDGHAVLLGACFFVGNLLYQHHADLVAQLPCSHRGTACAFVTVGRGSVGIVSCDLVLVAGLLMDSSYLGDSPTDIRFVSGQPRSTSFGAWFVLFSGRSRCHSSAAEKRAANQSNESR
jgi:hypothetical protein